MSNPIELNGYKPLELADGPKVTEALAKDPPLVSELTFTNLFMWRHYYRPQIGESAGCMSIIMAPADGKPFGLPPFGTGDKTAAIDEILKSLQEVADQPRISRASGAFVESHVNPETHIATPDRNQFDYVYLAQDLITLAGRKYHQKKNHLNQFKKNNEYEIRELTDDMIDRVLQMQEAWCELRDCAENPSLNSEDMAVYEAMSQFDELGFKGLAVLIDDKVEGFALGEALNPETVVIHVEKANPEIRGLYAAVNNFFCRDFWSDYRYINREQDLGVEGLRKAKESYKPDHLVEKYDVFPK